jgi:glutathione S-transferase
MNPMKHTLYYYPGNANLAAHILLEEAGCDYELVLVDRVRGAQKTDEYLRLNPNGTIPTLVSGSLVLFETAAICLHISDQHASACLVPPLGSQERAHLYKWMFFLSNTVQPAYMAFRYPEKHALPERAPPSETDSEHIFRAVRNSAAERAAQAFEVLERSLGENGPFMLGGRYSACDAYLYMLAWWARGLPRPPGQLPRVRRCVQAVAARQATKRACAAEEIAVYDPAADEC